MFIHPENQVARDFNRALINSSTDLVKVDMEIWGDPYYIADSGMGNYDALQLPGIININSDGSMDYLSSDVHIEVNFRTPLDYGKSWMEFPGGGSAPVREFSGIYKVNTVSNRFSNGQFTQVLKILRIPKQTIDAANTSVDTFGAVGTDDPSKQLTETNTNKIESSASSSQGGTGGQASQGDRFGGNDQI